MFSQRVPALYKWETLAINIIPTSYLSLVCVGSSHTVMQRDRGRDDGIEVTPTCKKSRYLSFNCLSLRNGVCSSIHSVKRTPRCVTTINNDVRTCSLWCVLTTRRKEIWRPQINLLRALIYRYNVFLNVLRLTTVIARHQFCEVLCVFVCALHCLIANDLLDT